MTTEAKGNWQLKGDVIGACNCDYGCPCEFEAPPTMGFCEGMGIYHINKGKFGDVSLDGLSFAFGIPLAQAIRIGRL